MIWDAGVSLCEAWLSLAPASFKEEFSDHLGVIGAIEKFKDVGEKPEGALPFSGALLKIAQSYIDKKNVEGQLKELLLDELFNSQFVATAYREAPSTSAAPVVIDANDFDDANIDWHNSKIRVDGKTYGQVRVTDENKITGIVAPKHKGRAGSGMAIRAAIDKLMKSNADFGNQHRGVACQQIRDELGKPHEYGNGLGDVNLSKFIVKICGIKAVH